MPVYGYECKKCGKVFDETRLIRDRDKITVCKCGGTASRLFVAAHTVVFEKRVFEYLDTYPIEIDSKKALREACKKRGIDTERVPALN